MNDSKRPPLPAGDPRHGTVNGYGNLSCRCQDCKSAWAVHYRSMRDRRAQTPLPAEDGRHGRASTYSNYRCRCTPCRTAWATYQRERAA